MLMFGTITPKTRLINRKLRPLDRNWVRISVGMEPFPRTTSPSKQPKMPKIAPDAPALTIMGAGIGLAPGTGALIAQLITGAATDLDLAPFRPDRFQEVRAS